MVYIIIIKIINKKNSTYNVLLLCLRRCKNCLMSTFRVSYFPHFFTKTLPYRRITLGYLSIMAGY